MGYQIKNGIIYGGGSGGGSSSASGSSFDDSNSSLNATNVQDAIDNMNTKIESNAEAIDEINSNILSKYFTEVNLDITE